MGAPNVICEQSDGKATSGNPCTLSPADVGHGLGDWKYIVNFTPPASVQQTLKKRFPNPPPEWPSVYHDIRNGQGECNLDFYAVQIEQLPKDDQGNEMGIDTVLDRVRQNLDTFLLHSLVEFEPYLKPGETSDDEEGGASQSPDDVTWKSSSPLGAVMVFKLKISLTITLPVIPRLPAIPTTSAEGSVTIDSGAEEHASVVCTEHAKDHWIFSTLWTKDAGVHPVAGNRQFGHATLKATDTLPTTYAGVSFNRPAGKDVLYIYTRGADRCSSNFYAAQKAMVFSGGHSCWIAFMNKILTWINQNGGKATNAGFVSKRWDWNNEIKKYLTVNP